MMPNLQTLEGVHLLIAFLVPGFVISYVRSLFLTGNEKQGAEIFVRYLTYSSLSYAVHSYIIYSLPTINPTWKPFTWTFIVLIGPMLIGALFGLSAQKGWGLWCLSKLGLRTVHPIATAWDKVFGTTGEMWVQVEMKNERRWAGYLGQRSFISSDPTQRDIYLEHVFRIGDDNCWTPLKSSVWLAGSEISSIEFWPVNRQITSPATDGKKHEQAAVP